jgi:hypothetical protein
VSVRLCPSAAASKLRVLSRWPMSIAWVEEASRIRVTFRIPAASGVETVNGWP